ncbi:MAG: glutamine synthetase beta-grasp domain-containing protein, partial [Candidatus Gracilibacteria bacterium]|nr:glutamine synthetase beta-grasp domain-containing protein [Candidatus Gracilibacteria bacterium]
MTKKQILELAERERVQFVNMQFTDINGIIKAVTIPVSKLSDAIDSNVWFDGSSVEGFARIFESDMYLKPDLATFAVIPWSRRSGVVTARMICDVYKPTGEPYSCDPRYILKKVLEKAKKKGWVFNTGPELEFFLFKKNEEGEIMALPHDRAGYFDMSTDMAAEIRKDMSIALAEFGIDVETLH